MNRRVWPSAILVLVMLLGSMPSVTASREDKSLRDGVYVSPTWGYSIRWYEDEWTVDEETSADGADRLWLRDAMGNLAGFEGRPGYGGDTRACLDDLMAVVEETASGDVAVVQDEFNRPQKIFHPWRSWIVLLAGYDDGDQVVDHLVYLDCRTLVPEEAVFIRSLIAPAATFSDELWHLDVMNAALPRGAWFGNIYTGLEAPGLDADWAASPLPVDSLWPWAYPDDPHLLVDATGMERGMLTQVDGDGAGRRFVVMIENSGTAPLTIDPTRFTVSNDPQQPRPDPDIAPVQAAWDDGVAPGTRTIAPEDWASLTLEFPAPQSRTQPTFLIYWNGDAHGGAVVLDCLDVCGYGGGGSRPRLRISR